MSDGHLANHIIDTHAIRCAQCDELLTTKAEIHAHIGRHEPKTMCFVCGVMVKLNPKVTKPSHKVTRMKVHLRTHTGEKHIRCELCDEAFKSNTSLKVHMAKGK